MSTRLPGFTADRSFARSHTTHRRSRPFVAVEPELRPAQQRPCRASRTSEACLTCWSDCIDGCGPDVTECFPSCRVECGGQPRDPGPVGGGAGGGGSAGPLIRYGAYCGPGWGDPTGATPPVDAVDAVCRLHDLCYASTTYFNCGCDRALLTAMPGAIAATPSPLGRAAGVAAISYFAAAPCTCGICPLGPFGPCIQIPIPAGIGGAGPC